MFVASVAGAFVTGPWRFDIFVVALFVATNIALWSVLWYERRNKREQVIGLELSLENDRSRVDEKEVS